MQKRRVTSAKALNRLEEGFPNQQQRCRQPSASIKGGPALPFVRSAIERIVDSEIKKDRMSGVRVRNYMFGSREIALAGLPSGCFSWRISLTDLLVPPVFLIKSFRPRGPPLLSLERR